MAVSDNAWSHRKIPPANDAWKRTPGKKNTVKWCKGHVGREHKVEFRLRDQWSHGWTCRALTEEEKSRKYFWHMHADDTWVCYHEEFCTVCGKIMEWSVNPTRCPIRIEEESK